MTINWRHYPAGENGFFRAPVLLTGKNEALLLDGGFTFDDGRKMIDAIKQTGKRLSAIYVSQSDPDYYFSLGPVRAAFPEARVLAAQATVAAIRDNVEKKLEVWGPKLKDNGPQSLAEVVLPEATDVSTLLLEGEEIEIVDAQHLANRRYLWVPSLSAIFGGVLVFSGVHVWVADTASSEARWHWIRNLDAMAARKPATVVPGHMAEHAPLGLAAIAYTRDYLATFEDELAKAKDSAALIAAMKRRYPSAGMEIALEIGAKVAKGEMPWG